MRYMCLPTQHFFQNFRLIFFLFCYVNFCYHVHLQTNRLRVRNKKTQFYRIAKSIYRISVSWVTRIFVPVIKYIFGIRWLLFYLANTPTIHLKFHKNGGFLSNFSTKWLIFWRKAIGSGTVVYLFPKAKNYTNV